MIEFCFKFLTDFVTFKYKNFSLVNNIFKGEMDFGEGRQGVENF